MRLGEFELRLLLHTRWDIARKIPLKNRMSPPKPLLIIQTLLNKSKWAEIHLPIQFSYDQIRHCVFATRLFRPHEVGHKDVATGCGVLSLLSYARKLPLKNRGIRWWLTL